MPKSVFQQKLNDIMKDEPTKDIIIDLFELQEYKAAEKDPNKIVFIELFNLLGFAEFTEVMDILAGKTVKFPTREEFKENVITALIYYYKNVRGYNWETIKSLIGETQQDGSSVRYGIMVQRLNKYMDFIAQRAGERKGENKDDTGRGTEESSARG